jgi:pimeloyl-ACP methyl ester carboxylesterase
MDYFRFGTGARNMVIIPGLSLKSVMESADFVAEAYSLFTDKYTVYVFDRRKELPPVYNVHDMARDTSVAMDALGIKDAYLFGISLGGMIAQVIAAERPDLVRKLMLGSTCGKMSEEAKDGLDKWIGYARSERVTELAIGFAEAVYSEKLMEKNRRAFSYLADMTTREELERFIILATGVSGFDMSSHLYKIQCPVLVMGGGKDKLIGREGLEQLAEKTHAELYIYEDQPHSVYDEAPDFKQRTFDFFEKD